MCAAARSLDVDVVADAGAVGRGVVVAKDLHALALPQSDLQDDGDEVRLGVMVLTDAAVVGRAGSVEVTQRRVPQAVGVGVVGKRVLHDELGESRRG